MKAFLKTIVACSVGLVLAGCAKEYDDSALKNDVNALKTQIEQIQNSIRSLNGQVTGLTETIEQWKKGGYVESIQELADKSGYTITFTGGKTVTLYHGAKGDKGDPGAPGEPGTPGTPGANGQNGTNGTNGQDGQDGKTPSLKLDTDGVFYWAIDGEFILVDGQKVPATVAPVFSINQDGDLIMTIGDKQTNLGHVQGDSGTAGVSLFDKIEPGEDVVVFTLKGGDSFSIPIAKAFKLVIEQPEQEVTAGQKLEIAYTVQNGNDNTTVDCFAGGNYTAKIADGKVIVGVPDPVADGQVLVWAQNDYGLFSMVKLIFTVKAEVVIVTPETDYQTLPAEGGTFDINLTSNVDVNVKLPEDATWLKATMTRASYKLGLTFEENTTGAVREAEIDIVRADNEVTVQKIKVIQLATVAPDPDPAQPGDILWAETWTGGEANATPETYTQTGTTVYGGLHVTYASTSPGSATKIYVDNQMDGSTNQENLLLSKVKDGANGTWTISGIPAAAAQAAKLTFQVNAKRSLDVTSPTEGVTIGEKVIGTETAKPYTISYDITIAEGVKKFNLVFTNSDSNNIRLDNIQVAVAGAETPKELKIQKLWEKLSTADANWFAAIGGTAGTDFNIAIDDKNVYIPEFGGSKNLWAIDIATGNTVSKVNTSTVQSVGFDGSIYLSCARVVKKADGTPILMASNLFQDGDADNPSGRLYVWENGVNQAPAVKTLQQWGAGRRLGDTWTTYGDYEDCWMIMGTQTGNGFVTFRVPTGGTSYLMSRLATETTDFCSYYPFPGELTKGMFAWRGGNHDDGLAYRNRLMTIASTEAAIKTEGAHTSTLTKLDKWMGNYENNNGSGFNYFEFNGKRYVAWVINMADGKTFDIVVKEGEAGAAWDSIINTPAADITAAGGFAFRESLVGGQATTWKQGTDCAVWNNGDEVYIAVNKINVGIAVYKMYME